MIPKIIFQTSIKKPEQYIIDLLLENAPNWTYEHYDDNEIKIFFKENYIEEFSNIIEKFDNMPTGQHKADLFRYYFIYVKGGVFIDSDAMLSMDINNIALNYLFFSINSTIVPNSIFQGFIGATSRNEIIYRALQDAYNVDTAILKSDYHLLCKNLFNIIKASYSDKLNNEIKLYHEGVYDNNTFKCYNDKNELILLHYWRRKIIPKETKQIAKYFNEITLTDMLSYNSIKSTAKNLVYFCVFHNAHYMDLLKILMTTIKFYSKTDNIDFLVFTSSNFVPLVNSISNLLRIPLLCKTFDFNTVFDAACARLYIFEYENIDQYEKILYLDTDIIVQNDLTTLFDEPIEDKIYAIVEGSIEHEYHGGWFFDFNTINKDTSGLNSGILLFKNSDTFKKIFKNIQDHIKELKASKSPLPACYDQPFINYHCIRNSNNDVKLMDKYGLIYCVNPPPPPSEPTDIILCHFVWPLGNALHKKNRMVNHINHILTNYKSITKNKETINVSLLNNINYSWGDSGIILFKENNVLMTTWSKGTYEWLDTHTLLLSWHGFDHIIRMNNSYTNYYSVRVRDLDIVYGYKK